MDVGKIYNFIKWQPVPVWKLPISFANHQIIVNNDREVERAERIMEKAVPKRNEKKRRGRRIVKLIPWTITKLNN